MGWLRWICLSAAFLIVGCASNGASPARDEARKVLTEAAVATAMHRFIDGDAARAERVQIVVAAIEPVLVDGVTVNTLVVMLDERIDWARYSPEVAELGRAAIILAALEMEAYVGGAEIPLSPEALAYVQRILAAADRAAGTVAGA